MTYACLLPCNFLFIIHLGNIILVKRGGHLGNILTSVRIWLKERTGPENLKVEIHEIRNL